MIDENISPRRRGRPRKVAPEYSVLTDHNVRVEFLQELGATLAPLIAIHASPTASDNVLHRNAAVIRAGVMEALQMIEAELE
jgi:hypothetical protein